MVAQNKNDHGYNGNLIVWKFLPVIKLLFTAGQWVYNVLQR